MEQYDVAVIGGGPGGYVAAIRAAQLKKKVVLIEKEHLGGVCLNWGCIPTKSLLKSAEVFEYIKHAKDYGIDAKGAEINIKKIVARSREISNKLAGGVKLLLKKNKVTVIDGVASLAGNKVININDKPTVKAGNIIIATGARSRVLKGFEPDGKQIWTSKEAMIPQHVPKSMIIVGSGAIGIEFASFYNSIGVDVTVIEAHNRILPAEDMEISGIAHKNFEKKGIKIITNAKLIKQTKSKDKIEVELELADKTQKLQAEILLMAVGITANTENLGLEKTKIKVENGYITTNGLMQTAASGIYAIGDVAGVPCLAHKASHEGIIAAESIAGLKPHTINKHNIPGCTYSSPQIASVGLTEEAATTLGYELKIGRFPFIANGKALVSGDSDGLIKTIFDAKTGELLGAHMIGSEVTELIQGYVVSKNLEGTELDLINTIFPHPTLSEMMHESVFSAYDRAIHI
ncbi:dihydrolipoyl dehydrogenase [Rickettsia parkeri str. Tate's Hell]|uniref:Dihydrolipoyl dehydrogenase n=1 Tax=Rickettsia parkeri str. Tate's Hell TaxID=1359189 RepID=A0ABR5DSD6_RICPA|nr:dihydrolipoyl dehydrogenase [Rickettsia parkeri]AFC75389.1 dihydrolipoamide dehydrogenase [Rickettsia parkeri str. Portsmouth]KJV94426.1 dihydrolipoyl dehydrogenase [Rickettsia parkeri str. Grand Bay]KJW01622.1 dihydrolipoyl dehydrogenase [Rickettsia parkeri str. Tate's Hell]